MSLSMKKYLKELRFVYHIDGKKFQKLFKWMNDITRFISNGVENSIWVTPNMWRCSKITNQLSKLLSLDMVKQFRLIIFIQHLQ